MTAVLRFIICTFVIGALYTGELFVITDLFMPHGRWRGKRIIGHSTVLIALYSYLIYKYGMSDDLWYVGLSGFILNNFLHEGKLKTRIWVFFITYAISVGGEGLVCVLLDQIYTVVGYEGTSWLWDDVMPHLSAFLVAMGVSQLLRKTLLVNRDLEAYNELSKVKCIGLSLIGIIYAVVFNTISIMYIYGENVQLASCMMFFGVYFTLFLIILVILHNHIKLKKTYASRKVGILRNVLVKRLNVYQHLEEVDQEGENMKKVIDQEIAEIVRLVGAEEKEKLQPYIEVIQRRLAPKMTQVISGNEIIELLLQEKNINAQELGIAFEMNVSVPEVLNVNIVDLCIIIDCTLDYIIKQCHKGSAQEKEIKVKGIWFKGYLMFEIWYTLDKEMKLEIGYGTLPDELEIATKCLNKYNGNIELTGENHLRKIELSFNTVGGAKCLSYS